MANNVLRNPWCAKFCWIPQMATSKFPLESILYYFSWFNPIRYSKSRVLRSPESRWLGSAQLHDTNTMQWTQGVLARSKAVFFGFLYKHRFGSDHATKLSCMKRFKLQVPAVLVRSSCLYIPHTLQIVLGVLWRFTKTQHHQILLYQ